MKNTTQKVRLLLMPLLFYFCFTGYGQIITPTVTSPCTPNTGAVTFSITGGTTGYMFYLQRTNGTSYPGQSSPTFTGLPSGSYYVYASNSLDSLSANFTISSLVTATPTVTNATCTQSNGGASVVGSGGTGPYSYQWMNYNFNSLGTGTSISGEPAGNYYVLATDQNGCQSDTTPVSILAASPITATLTSNGSVCSPVLTLSATGGAVPYTYAWNTLATTNSISVTNSGTYSATVTDINGCSASQVINLTVNPLMIDSMSTIISQPTCVGNNGSIDILISQSNGTGPYTFVWSNSATDSILTGLSAGSYSTTITDSHGCVGNETFYLSDISISAYISVTNNPGCGVSDGSITAIGYNGTAPYNYVWSPAATGATLSAIPAGTYTVTATDANLCTAVASVTLTSQGNYSVSITTTPTACDTNLHTGTATAVISGSGNAPYNFTWYSYVNYPSIVGTTQTITNLSYGTSLTLSVTDADGCVPTNVQYLDSGDIGFDPSCYDHITGYVYLDANGNCIMDAGEQGINGTTITATNAGGQSYYGSTNSAGFFDIEVMPGTYTVQEYLSGYGYCASASCATSFIDTFFAVGDVSLKYFGISGGGAADLGIHPGCSASAPGTQKQYWVYYYNNGGTTANNAVVSFTYDDSLTLVSTSPPYSSINAATNTISWNVGALAPTVGNWYTGYINMTFNVPATLPLGYTLYAQAEIDPIAGDCNPADNIVNISNIVTGSHDPNSKSVSPAGNLTASDSVLTYTIQFENDGNAPANTIVIKDTLSSNVNPATFQPGASSFPDYKYTITGKGIITFTFQGINLPDTSHGAASQGFVTYSVRTKSDLPIGTQVDNTAYVYFDVNPAVITNTTTSLRSDFPLGISTLKGGSMNAQVIPNPAHDKAEIQFTGYTGTIVLEITDALGNVITSFNVDNKSYTLDAESLASGLYFYTAKDANGNKASGKISIVH